MCRSNLAILILTNVKSINKALILKLSKITYKLYPMDLKTQILDSTTLIRLIPFYKSLNRQERFNWLLNKLKTRNDAFYQSNQINNILINLYRLFISKRINTFAQAHSIKLKTFQKWLKGSQNKANRICKRSVADYILNKLGIEVKFEATVYRLAKYSIGTLLTPIVEAKMNISYVEPDESRTCNPHKGIARILLKIDNRIKNIVFVDYDNSGAFFRSFGTFTDPKKDIPELLCVFLVRKGTRSVIMNRLCSNVNCTVIETNTQVHNAADLVCCASVMLTICTLEKFKLFPTITLISSDKFIPEVEYLIKSFSSKFKVVTDSYRESKNFLLDLIINKPESMPYLVNSVDLNIRKQILNEYRIITADLYQNAVEIINNIKFLSNNSLKHGYYSNISSNKSNLTISSYQPLSTLLPLLLRLDILYFALKRCDLKIKQRIQSRLKLSWSNIKNIVCYR